MRSAAIVADRLGEAWLSGAPRPWGGGGFARAACPWGGGLCVGDWREACGTGSSTGAETIPPQLAIVAITVRKITKR